MDVRSLDIPDVKLIAPEIFRDHRGFFSETYTRRGLNKAGIDVEFVQDNHSLSVEQGVVRGLHYQIPPHAQDKLIRVARGAILDVAVDIRMGSPTFGNHVAVRLSAENWRQLWVPRGFAHGFCTLEPDTEVIYKITDYYTPESERGILWCDPDLDIPWRAGQRDPILSDKDRAQPLLREIESPFAYPK